MCVSLLAAGAAAAAPRAEAQGVQPRSLQPTARRGQPRSYVFLGQSNTKGCAARTDVSEKMTARLRAVAPRITLTASGGGAPQLQDFLGPDPPFFGPELHFARVLAEADPDASLLLYKSWSSGISIADELERPGDETRKKASVSLRGNSTAATALGMLNGANPQAVIWFQGEGDIRDEAPSIAAERYSTNLQALIAAVRAQSGTERPALFLVVETHRTNSARCDASAVELQRAQMVTEAKRAASRDLERVVFLANAHDDAASPDFLPSYCNESKAAFERQMQPHCPREDAYAACCESPGHLNAEGQRRLGERLAKAVLADA